MKHKIYNIIMYGTDEEKLKLFILWIICNEWTFSKYTFLYLREVRKIQRELNQVNNIRLRLEYKLIGRWLNEI